MIRAAVLGFLVVVSVQAQPTVQPSPVPTSLVPTSGAPSASTGAPISATGAPTPNPTSSPTEIPTSLAPTLVPTLLPTAVPTGTPTTAVPSFFPTRNPSAAPTGSPTSLPPTFTPTSTPSANPTLTPTSVSPTDTAGNPTAAPTIAPSSSAPTTLAPTAIPTLAPTALTAAPTDAPTALTAAPTETPTAVPTEGPTSVAPTSTPTSTPTPNPTLIPTTTSPTDTAGFPTAAPTSSPSSVAPTTFPTLTPTALTPGPTVSPTAVPSRTPTDGPTSGTPTVAPTLRPTPSPTASPTSRPTDLPSRAPTASPSAAPTAQPTSQPSPAPTFAPSASPTVNPTSVPTTSAPSGAPTSTSVIYYWLRIDGLDQCSSLDTSIAIISSRLQNLAHGGVLGVVNETTPVNCTHSPTALPTESPTAQPTELPTASPSAAPSASPTANPTAVPTAAPSAAPTASPTAAPSASPTDFPTDAPSARPTAAPSASPTSGPTFEPTANPTAPTASPTHSPTAVPSANPTRVPTTVSPSANPTATPTSSPSTARPSAAPTTQPTTGQPTTASPTSAPSAIPTEVPSLNPTAVPTLSPNDPIAPTSAPTAIPTEAPSVNPTAVPTLSPNDPTSSPTAIPTEAPSINPTAVPTLSPNDPSESPTTPPTASPSASPTSIPSTSPSTTPPTAVPSLSPSSSPSTSPSVSPSASPSASPTTTPPVTRTRNRRQSCPAGTFNNGSECVRCLAFQYSLAGSSSCSIPTECLPGEIEVLAPTITNNRVCATASNTHALIVFEFTVDAAQIDSVAQALKVAATDDSLDGSVNGDDFFTALPVPSVNDPPLLDYAYEVVVVDIRPVSRTNRDLFSNPSLFFSELYLAIPDATPQAVEPFGTLVIEITSFDFTFRVASLVNFTTDQGSARPALAAWLASAAFDNALFNNSSPQVDLNFTITTVGNPLQTNPPTGAPSVSPTLAPTLSPTTSPTASPSQSPTTSAPTQSPTVSPTVSPTSSPSLSPSTSPTETPSVSPTLSPTVSPTESPTLSPTIGPTISPSQSPTTLASTQSASGGGGGGGAAVAAAVVIVLILVVVAAGLVYKRKRDEQWPFEQSSQPPPGTYASPPHHEVIQMRPMATPQRPTTKPPGAPQAIVTHSSAPATMYAAEQAAPGSDQGLKIPPLPTLSPVQTHPVALADLSMTIEQMAANSDFAFSEEYECLETGNEFSREAARLNENKIKNRYANILPYDHTRVRLSMIPGDPYSDYVNANYISSRSEPRKYIAAQGPTQLTAIDFWRMLWESKVPVVVMVTNCEEKGRIKCHRYWPASVGEPMPLMDGFSVTWTSTEEFPDFVIRSLKMVNGRERFTVKQFHYTSWPDHGVPESTAAALMMLRKARAARVGHDGPMLVHCSAGVGRTGTLLGIDINIDRMADTGDIDVYGTLNQMRRERNTVVQTEEQYIFIYRALADASTNMNTEMNADELVTHSQRLRSMDTSGTTVLEAEFKQLSAVQSSMNFRTDSAQLSVNKTKNRFQNVLPYESTRVKLVPLPGVMGSDYINASFIDGYTSRQAFIATQGPLENTLADFWRMAWEREVDVIVMLTELVENGRAKSDQYWPDADEGTITLGDFQVVLDREHATVYGFERSVTLIDLVSEASRRIKQFQYVKWPEADEKPDAETVRSLLAAIKVHQDSKIVLPEENIYGNAAAITEHAIAAQTKPILVHDSAGVGRTGAFCALHISMKKLQMEGKIDVFTVVKHMRTQRMSMVQTPSQYEWVYSVLTDCVVNSALTEQLYVNLRQDSARRNSIRSVESDNGAPPPLPSKAAPSPPRQDDFDEPTTVQETSLIGDSFAEAASSPVIAETSFNGTSDLDDSIADDFDEVTQVDASGLVTF